MLDLPRCLRSIALLTLLAPVGSPAVAAETGKAAAPPAAEAVELKDLVGELDQASLQEAFRVLRSDYIKRESLSYLELNRAAMQGLLERLDFGAMLLTRADREARDAPYAFFSEKLSPEVGYVRFGKYRRDELEALDKALVRFSGEAGLDTLIVDLRSPQAMADFEIAAQILSRFRPGGELVFKIRRPHEDRPRLFTTRAGAVVWDRRIIVLIDRETGNVGEIIAAVLRNTTGSLVIGETTIGMTVEYRDVPLAADRILRYAVAEVALPDGSSLFQKGVTPDVVTVVPSNVKQAVFRASERDGLAAFVFEKARPRMNEAALVAGTDPELDYYVAKSNGRDTDWDRPILRDRVLRQAVDLLAALPALEAGRAAAAKKAPASAPAPPADGKEADAP
ncbi:MAG: S41 family peptidase [Verrucomicrobiales bacterium]|nr:S41 family peptidase [Verrucomicrobiales bacterium]